MPIADLYQKFLETRYDIQTLFQSFTSFFSFWFALISEVFLGVGNNVVIAFETNFLFIGLSV